MKRLLTFALAVAAVSASLSANATWLDAKFSGAVQTQAGTSFLVNSPISGEFWYNTATGNYLSFTIGGYSVAPGFDSSAVITFDKLSAIYQAQVSPVPSGSVNSTFTVDLESLTQWPSLDAVALLTDSSQLPSNLDTDNSDGLDIYSTFGFYIGDASATDYQYVTASLASIAVTAIPEPGSLPLAMIAFAAMVGASRRVRIR